MTRVRACCAVLERQPRYQLLRHVRGGRLEAGHRHLRCRFAKDVPHFSHDHESLRASARKRLRERCTTIALKLSRPGFGPALKRLVQSKRGRRPAGRHALAPQSRRDLPRPLGRSGFGTWALAAQLSACVSQTTAEAATILRAAKLYTSTVMNDLTRITADPQM